MSMTFYLFHFLKIKRVKWASLRWIHEANHSLHLVPRSKNERSYTSTPQYAFMGWCSVKRKQRGNVTCTFYIGVHEWRSSSLLRNVAGFFSLFNATW
jgi:hypothetical protein